LCFGFGFGIDDAAGQALLGDLPLVDFFCSRRKQQRQTPTRGVCVGGGSGMRTFYRPGGQESVHKDLFLLTISMDSVATQGMRRQTRGTTRNGNIVPGHGLEIVGWVPGFTSKGEDTLV
jgi:hypothetical protein